MTMPVPAMSPPDHGRAARASPGVLLPLRHAQASDLKIIEYLNEAAYARYADRMDQLPAPVLHDYRPEVEAGAVWLIGEPALGLIVTIQAEDSLLIENVAVLPSVQGTGVGRQLMEFAEHQAMTLGLRRLTLYTNEVMVENLAIYARLGYRESARRAEHGYHRVFMEKSISRPTC